MLTCGGEKGLGESPHVLFYSHHAKHSFLLPEENGTFSVWPANFVPRRKLMPPASRGYDEDHVSILDAASP